MLVGVGVLAASGAALAARSSQMQQVMRLAPLASAVILTAIGAGMLDEGLVLLGL